MKHSILLYLVAFLVILGGCAQSGADSQLPADSEQAAAPGREFIFVCPILENEYWVKCIEGIREADVEFGTHTTVIGPRTADHFDVEIVDYMEDAVARQPDGIMAYAGIEGLYGLIDRAAEGGIPVLAIDSDAPDTKRAAYVGTDLYHFGFRSGETIVELTGGTGQIGYVCSSYSAQNEAEVFEAFLDATQDYDMDVVAKAEGHAEPDYAERVVRQMLEEHPEITAIFCTGGYNLTGAARAKAALGLDELVLVGFDDVEENLDFVRSGEINALLVQSPKEMGYLGVRLLNEYVNNGGLPYKSYDTGNLLVTRENVNIYSSERKAAEDETEKVRVGYYSGDAAFQDGYGDDLRKSGYAYEYYQAIAALAGWSYEYVYGSRTEVMEMLLAGEVDIVAGIYRTDAWADQLLFSGKDMGIDGAGRYFAVNAARNDLLDDLNYAMEQLQQYSPDFSVSLRQKYYSSTTQQVLTDSEKEWLRAKESLRIGYVRHNLPFSEQGDDGKPIGFICDLTELMAGYLQVETEPVCYECINDMEQGLLAGEIDVAFPMYSDLWLTEQKGLWQTEAFLSDRAMVVYFSGDTSDLMSRVALSRTGIGQKYYMDTYYPDSELVFYESREAVFAAIRKGEERCIIGCSSILQRFLKEHSEYQDMNIAYLDTSENFGMAVRQDSGLLVGILNKAIRQMEPGVITSALMKYSSVDAAYTFSDVLRRYSVEVILVLLMFFAILVLGFVGYYRKTRIFNEEQKKSRSMLEEAYDAAKVASEAKTAFLSSMSHDIRTPMNAIIGMTTIAKNYLNDPVRLGDCLDKIDLSGHHLLTLINDVLDISKIESGKLTLNPADFSISETVTALVNIVRPQIQDKNLQFDVSMQGIDYDTVYADEVRVKQIFINILTNAVKYTPEGGRVELRLTEKLLEDEASVRLTYVVRDTGIGMSEEFMQSMYETFTREKDGRINKIQGTGLGLSIVRKMVDMMGGTIDCFSGEGKGTQFTVTFDVPIRKKESDKLRDDHAASGNETGQDDDLKGLHLLIAEDNDLNWEIIRELLDMCGITAERAENGQICVDKLAGALPGTYDMILMDIQMPVMNGRDASRAIRADERDYVRDIPILAMTADAFAEDIAACLEAGMNGHVSKPVDMNKLFWEMRKALHEAEAKDGKCNHEK